MTENKNQGIRDLLLSKNEEIVNKTIGELREKGKATDLDLLIGVFEETDSNETKKLISQFFCDLKLQSSAPSIVRLLKTSSNKSTLKMLASSCWQSRLNYVNYFELFIDLVIHEGFEISFEAFTVLENFEEATSDGRKKELLTYLLGSLNNCKDENLVFANDLVKIIENYQV